VNTIPVGVLGASGYAGRELCAILARHPRFTLAFATANEQRGHRVRLGGRDVTFMAPDEAPLASAALVFSALPHGASLPWVTAARDAGARVVDLSTDLRPGNDVALDAIYGMPELGAATRYPTAILLALAPLVRAGLVRGEATIVANAASGVSGAGNAPRRELLFAEVADDYRAYGVGNTHRHLREMIATLATLGSDAELVFTPHLLPVARGILATLTVPLTSPLADPVAFFRGAYAGEPFVEVESAQPALADVVRRNAVRLSATMLAGTRAPMLLVTSAIDNLVKGAAGQAVQNANLMCGFDEGTGLAA
jgi:N-acetyl-gamma-glutamyl-phosphate reductase